MSEPVTPDNTPSPTPSGEREALLSRLAEARESGVQARLAIVALTNDLGLTRNDERVDRFFAAFDRCGENVLAAERVALRIPAPAAPDAPTEYSDVLAMANGAADKRDYNDMRRIHFIDGYLVAAGDMTGHPGRYEGSYPLDAPTPDEWRGSVPLNRLAQFMYEAAGGSPQAWADPQTVSQQERSRFFALARAVLTPGEPLPCILHAVVARDDAAGSVSTERARGTDEREALAGKIREAVRLYGYAQRDRLHGQDIDAAFACVLEAIDTLAGFRRGGAQAKPLTDESEVTAFLRRWATEESVAGACAKEFLAALTAQQEPEGTAC